jgi:hypothetical protein
VANPQVVVSGLKETMQILKAADAEYSKHIRSRINTASTRVLKAARDDVPSGNALSNWGAWNYSYTYKRGSRRGQNVNRGLGFSGSDVQKNMKKSRANMRKRGYNVSNYLALISNDPAGIVWQTAGKNSSGRGTTGSPFVMNIMRKYPGKRGLWKAFDSDKRAVPEIEAAARDAEKFVQNYLNQVGRG